MLSTPKPPAQGDIRRTPSHIVEEIGKLLNEHTDAHIAQILNERGELTGNRQAFTSKRVELFDELMDSEHAMIALGSKDCLPRKKSRRC